MSWVEMVYDIVKVGNLKEVKLTRRKSIRQR